jgi:hypothetical protein
MRTMHLGRGDAVYGYSDDERGGGNATVDGGE